ncbi:hypothetical protein JMJ77_0007420 [Colletotrichum scovillei]|uniref:Uncharacterized protein n=1 Tax=Colletotrichum scovillei TaxID=1209932 RepID=A0A9P7RD07_9PEZI|nr:hypothetical protein JMJ77_0007420 [Colletotrichum scovillei]KAG7074394.1 hypothetical protein JMJ76_0010874 [Colletotrichum scovillei]KAG7081260.1 hypothetical protein JMJ78_0003385 [Colletotrichum scovillei]
MPTPAEDQTREQSNYSSNQQESLNAGYLWFQKIEKQSVDAV